MERLSRRAGRPCGVVGLVRIEVPISAPTPPTVPRHHHAVFHAGNSTLVIARADGDLTRAFEGSAPRKRPKVEPAVVAPDGCLRATPGPPHVRARRRLGRKREHGARPRGARTE